MAYEFITKGPGILFMLTIVFLLFAVAFSPPKYFKLWLFFIIVGAALSIGAMLVWCIAGGRITKEYTVMTERHSIDFLKEDSESDLVVYAYDDEQFFVKRGECEIIIVDEDVSESNDLTLPYVEKCRIGTYQYYDMSEQKVSSQPEIKEEIYFYVPQSYLDNSDWDWTFLFENNN